MDLFAARSHLPKNRTWDTFERSSETLGTDTIVFNGEELELVGYEETYITVFSHYGEFHASRLSVENECTLRNVGASVCSLSIS